MRDLFRVMNGDMLFPGIRREKRYAVVVERPNFMSGNREIEYHYICGDESAVCWRVSRVAPRKDWRRSSAIYPGQCTLFQPACGEGSDACADTGVLSGTHRRTFKIAQVKGLWMSPWPVSCSG